MTHPLSPEFRIFRSDERPDLRAAADRLSSKSWPAFLDGNAATRLYWDGLYTGALAEFQYFAVAIDMHGEEVFVGASNSIPFHWATPEDASSLPDGGWDHVIAQGTREAGLGIANALSALAIIIEPAYRKSALADQLILNMRETARRHGFIALVAPIRPTRKQDYPLTSFADYVGWTNAAGEPFDPWVRKHWRLGARVAKIAPHSMTVSGSIQQWEQWTGLRFPVSGHFHVAGGLAPVMADVAGDQALYLEPNLWMRHTL